MTPTRAEFRFQHRDRGEIVVQCIFRGPKIREFTVIVEGRVVRIGAQEVRDNVWACATHAEMAMEKALDPKKRRTPKIARAERRKYGQPRPRDVMPLKLHSD